VREDVEAWPSLCMVRAELRLFRPYLAYSVKEIGSGAVAVLRKIIDAVYRGVLLIAVLLSEIRLFCDLAGQRIEE
jgi:hypothetical protein